MYQLLLTDHIYKHTEQSIPRDMATLQQYYTAHDAIYSIYDYYEKKCGKFSGCNRVTDYKDYFLLRRNAV
jgi:hypothetical protein